VAGKTEGEVPEVTGVKWLEWGEQALAQAVREQKPILLDISAVWCHWCHVMDGTTYSDPEVAERINRDFIPVRVDTDRRPDVNSRYNMGGWPTTAFLTPEGEILTGATYLPPEDMKRALDKVARFYRENRAKLASPAESTAARKAAIPDSAGPDSAGREGTRRLDGDLDDEAALDVLRDILKVIGDTYDPVHGGFGMAPKFPHPAALELLLVHHLRTGEERPLVMVTKTLEAMVAGGLHDRAAGGFFRYSTTRDWAIPHYEKMLEDNSRLLALYARTARLTGDVRWEGTVVDIAGFLETWLRSDDGYFFGSQDADEEYYRLTREEREKRRAPRVDQTLYVGWNALATRGLLEAYLTMGEPRLREMGLVALEYVWQAARLEDGRIGHYCDKEGPHGPVLLADSVELALALIDAYEVTGERSFLDRALGLLEEIRVTFGDPAGKGFFDTPEGGEKLGRLRVRHKDLAENARVALAFLRLADTVLDPGRRAFAREILSGFLGQHRRHGILAADYGLALDWAIGPTVEVAVSGSREEERAAKLLIACAGAVSAARALRRSVPGEDDDAEPAAYICVGQKCLEPVQDPLRAVEVIRRAGRRERFPEDSGAAGGLELPAGGGEGREEAPPPPQSG